MLYPIYNGFATGYGFSENYSFESSVQQGENYTLTAFARLGNLIELGSAINKLADIILKESFTKTLTKKLCLFTPFIVFPIYLFAAKVKHGHYQDITRLLPGYLPEKLGLRTKAILNFITKYTSAIVMVAMVINSVAFVIFKNRVWGIASLLGLGYPFLSARGYIPERVQFVMKRVMPIVSRLNDLIYGGIFKKILTITELFIVVSFTPTSTQHKIDAWINNNVLRNRGINLRDAEAPLVRKGTSLSYQEIRTILSIPPLRFPSTPSLRFELNPPHLCASFDLELPEDPDLESLITLFDTVDWNNNLHLIKLKLRDDERFISQLIEAFPVLDRSDLTNEETFNHYFDSLATANFQTPDAFAAAHVRQQMQTFANVLTRNQPAIGSQEDLATAINQSHRILAYLRTLDPRSIEYQDILLKLAIEGGAYCTTGMGRATGEVLSAITSQHTNREANPNEIFERRVLSTLQTDRLRRFQTIYTEMMPNTSALFSEFALNIHVFNHYKLTWALGWIPFSAQERASVTLWHVIFSKIFKPVHMASEYQISLKETIIDSGIGVVDVVDYLRRQIGENTTLSDHQKEDLIDILGGYDQINVEAFNTRLFQLMLVMLGVLKLRQ